jgi:hypothetical protein
MLRHMGGSPRASTIKGGVQDPRPERAKELSPGLSPGFQSWVNRHAKMRPESGARMKRRARIISIRYGARRNMVSLQGTSP